MARRMRRAAEALAQAKADARARGEPLPSAPGPAPAGAGPAAPAPPPGVPAAGGQASGGAAGPVAAGVRPARPRRDDPQPLHAAVDDLLAEQGWRAGITAGSLFGRWEAIVGPDLAAHTRPLRLADGELMVSADSTAWATQLRLLAARLVRRLNEELGNGTVRRVSVRGPAPPPSAGRWRVRGGRGPRDDYG